MGFVRKLFKPKKRPPPVQAVAQTAPKSAGESGNETAESKEQKRKSKILALNAGSGQKAQTIGGSGGNVTSKTLLGL